MNLVEAERTLEASPDHRLLRRIPAAAHWRLKSAGSADLRRAVFVDVETTGLNHESDEVIEIALLPFDYIRDSGEIVRICEEAALESFRQPSFPIPPASTLVHGISDADVAGCVVDEARLASVVEEAHLIIAHNAQFDRPMVEKHWPIFARKHWACSLADIDWRAEALASGKLDYLLMRQGWFYDGHRALGDAAAGVFLLNQSLPVTARPALAALLESARRPLKAVRAEETAFEQRAALKARGYRWDAGDARRAKAWWILTEDSDAEIAWLNSEIYREPRAIRVLNMPATRRYSARLWT
jgi:DNA polymerase-3 subunit epsilon